MNSVNKKVLSGSLLTLAATGMAVTPAVAVTPATADASGHGDYSQNIEIIGDVCPTVQDIDVIVPAEVLDEARAFQCNEIRQHSHYEDESAAPALPLLGKVQN
ncbi:hypothetical protein AB0I94_25070 [Streptomyces sp. NPDC050147]|uniref:hypothetical protein n=1 Tax=Streptomyces sp. NPDC050147 TaxID=3155513 RepID=UPI003424C55C